MVVALQRKKSPMSTTGRTITPSIFAVLILFLSLHALPALCDAKSRGVELLEQARKLEARASDQQSLEKIFEIYKEAGRAFLKAEDFSGARELIERTAVLAQDCGHHTEALKILKQGRKLALSLKDQSWNIAMLIRMADIHSVLATDPFLHYRIDPGVRQGHGEKAIKLYRKA